MTKFFISYRRTDSRHGVGRLHGSLKAYVRDPKRDIFLDIDNIPKGVDFVQHLAARVAQCNAMLVVIGPTWLNAKDDKGGRRLDDPNDYVRVEVASALKIGIPVVPVVLDDTPIPSASDLPDDLKALARRAGERLVHESFDADVLRLVQGLNLGKSAVRKENSFFPAFATALLIAGIIGLASWVGFVDPFSWRQGIRTASAEPNALASPAIAHRTIVYSGANFGGAEKSFDGPILDLGIAGFNDVIRSVKIEGGPWRFCEHAGFNGRCIVVDHSEPDLEIYGFAAQASSLIELPAGTTYQQNSKIVLGAWVELFSEPEFAGRRVVIDSVRTALSSISFDNVAQSVRVHGGAWLLCDNPQFTGTCTVAVADMPSLARESLSQRVSSVTPVPQ